VQVWHNGWEEQEIRTQLTIFIETGVGNFLS